MVLSSLDHYLPPFGYSEYTCCNLLCITETCAGMPALTPQGVCRCHHNSQAFDDGPGVTINH